MTNSPIMWPRHSVDEGRHNVPKLQPHKKRRTKTMNRSTLLILCLAISCTCSDSKAQMNPPKADRKPKTLTTLGHERIDPYFWMNDRENPEVIKYLNAENEYLQSQLASTKDLQTKLFEETKSRIKQTDVTVPYPDRGYDYYRRTTEDKQYAIYCRKKIGSEDEQVILDVNQLAKGHAFCSVRSVDVSADTKTLAYASDTVGRRIYTIRFKDLATDELLPDVIENSTGNLTFAEDNKTLYYARQDAETLRSYQIYRHTLGTNATTDELVYEEKDEEFSCYVAKSRSREFVMIQCHQTLSNEVRYISATDPSGEFQVVQPREPNHEYIANHFDGHFYIRTNENATNFRLMKVSDENPAKENWQEVLPHSDDEFLVSFQLFKDYLAVQVRKNGLAEIRYRKTGEDKWSTLEFNDPAYNAFIAATDEPDTPWLRYSYESMTTPRSVYERNMISGEIRLLKQKEILGGFDAENYRSERQWVSARDGVKVPVSIVYRKDTKLDGSAPCLLYGYGSYGASIPPSFDPVRLNLLDRGFVYAIAHIRGGQVLGRHWYENGKLLKKKNTFYDFIDAGRFLVAEKYSDPERLYARGGSAGGLLIGAAINMDPKLFHGVIADVPFVDVVTTMLDTSIPLTTSEFDEWGDPSKKEFYDYMLSYSPYDNVQKVDYPNMLVTSGLHDSQVQFFEPTKWVAKLRDKKTDDNLLLLKTNMDAGHGGASGRYDSYRERVIRHAFLLHLAGIKE